MSKFVNAWRADTGEEVRIPRTHLSVFPGAFQTTAPEAADAAPAAPKPRRKAEPKQAETSADDTKERDA